MTAWPLLGSRWGYLYLKNVVPCLNLGCYHMIFSNSCCGLDTCSCLIGGPCNRIVLVSFFWNVGTSLTATTRLWRLQHVLDSCGTSLPAIIIHGMWLALLSCTVDCCVVRTDLWPSRLASDLVGSPLKSLRLLEEVIRGHLFLSSFITSVGQA